MHICNCYGITTKQLIAMVEGSTSVFQYAAITKEVRDAGGCCRCFPEIKEVIDAAHKSKANRHKGTPIS